ncbi:lmo0937 family membrane protein [Alkalicoccobacillus porphyridii]|uniref:Lmo0937 family membrane protein n=1 Tax=Alkalicoccobacillus porphyridii TaxID=2597270 RepID=A0A553ZXI0_9BACI|nr:lmo0937 family membrane protein [Alkalicoccobacillus porphyridii]TSB46167.1 lmo0937 family membrane protein [Alkalicoccobacillus porphyridii]
MLWTIIMIILGLWLVGLIFRIAGNFIHILLLAAAIVLVYQLIVKRR